MYLWHINLWTLLIGLLDDNGVQGEGVLQKYVCRFSVLKPERTWPEKRRRLQWEDNKKANCEGEVRAWVYWFQLALDGAAWRALATKLICAKHYFIVPMKIVNTCTSGFIKERKFNVVHPVVSVERLSTNRLLSVEHNYVLFRNSHKFRPLRPSSDHQYNISK